MGRSLILRNIINLSVSEVISRLLNFISYVYLARVILADGFGTISFVIAFSSYFLLIVNFSSDIIASREVARLQANRETFVSQIISTRILLAIVSYALFSVLVILLSTTSTIRVGLLIYGLTFFAQAINLSWYFKGREKTAAITFAQISSSLINLLLVIILVKNKTDLTGAIVIFTSVAFINSMLMLIIYNGREKIDAGLGNERETPLILDAGLRREGKGRLILDAGLGNERKTRLILDAGFIPPLAGFIKNSLKESFPVAIAGIMISIYYNLDHVMLGYITDSTELGYYAAAYKIIIIALVPAGIIYQSFLPQLSNCVNDPVIRKDLMKTYSRWMLSLGAFSAMIIFLFADQIVEIVYGGKFEGSVLLMRILSFNIFLVFLNMTYGSPLIAWNKQKLFFYPIAAAAIGNIILNILLIPRYHALGAAVATISSELIVLAGFLPMHKKVTMQLHTQAVLEMKSVV
ncbi:MAG: flippase [Bacteroidota bacterium]